MVHALHQAIVADRTAAVEDTAMQPCRMTAIFTQRALPLIVAAALAACATNPATGKKEVSLMSEAQEIGLGQQMDPEVRR